MPVVGVVIIRQGLVTDKLTLNSERDFIEAWDMDKVDNGECPRCECEVREGVCTNCGIDWYEEDEYYLAEQLLNGNSIDRLTTDCDCKICVNPDVWPCPHLT